MMCVANLEEVAMVSWGVEFSCKGVVYQSQIRVASSAYGHQFRVD
jgi:hypothetical protein